MSLAVRWLRLEDAPLAGRLVVEYKRNAYARILPADRLDRLDLDHSVKLCRNLLKDRASNAIFVAFVNGEPAGICAAGRLRWKKHVPPEYQGEIHTLYVKSEFRRHYRLADRLWSHAIDWLERARIEKAVAFILEENRLGRAYMRLRGGRVIALKHGDGLWADHNILIHALDHLKRPIPRTLLPELGEDDEDDAIPLPSP